MNRSCTGVVVFAYNRPDSLERLLRSIEKSEDYRQFTYYLVCDGPKSNDDSVAISRIKDIAQDSSIVFARFFFNSCNQGLKNNIYTHVSLLFATHRALIVLEDDLVLAPQALRYFDSALNVFCGNNNICQISGYLPPCKFAPKTPFFASATTSWGWATWDYAWKDFALDLPLQVKKLHSTKTRFAYDIQSSYPFSYVTFLEEFSKVSSWAIRWFNFNFFRGCLTLYPPFPLVYNLGITGKRTHGLLSLFRSYQHDGHRQLFADSQHSITLKGIPVVADNSTYARCFRSHNILLRAFISIRWRLRYLILIFS